LVEEKSVFTFVELIRMSESLVEVVKRAFTGPVVVYKNMWYLRWTPSSFIELPIRIVRFWSHPIRYPFILGGAIYCIGVYSIVPSEEVKAKSAYLHKAEWVKADNDARQEKAWAKRYAEIQLENALKAQGGHGHH